MLSLIKHGHASVPMLRQDPSLGIDPVQPSELGLCSSMGPSLHGGQMAPCLSWLSLSYTAISCMALYHLIWPGVYICVCLTVQQNHDAS